MIIESSTNGRWMFPFKKFDMVRVKIVGFLTRDKMTVNMFAVGVEI